MCCLQRKDRAGFVVNGAVVQQTAMLRHADCSAPPATTPMCSMLSCFQADFKCAAGKPEGPAGTETAYTEAMDYNLYSIAGGSLCDQQWTADRSPCPEWRPLSKDAAAQHAVRAPELHSGGLICSHTASADACRTQWHWNFQWPQHQRETCLLARIRSLPAESISPPCTSACLHG